MTGEPGARFEADPADERPSSAAVIEELARVLASDTFRGAKRSREFLSYVVTETLAGRDHRLSERTVARHGLDRGDGFDGRADASVRVRASRVRRALHEYYAAEGAKDRVRLDLPAGGYVPLFTFMPVTIRDEEVVDPSIAVLVLDAVGPEPAAALARMISEALVARMSSFPGLRVIGPAGSQSVDPRRIGRELGTRFVLQGSVVVRDQEVRLGARVTESATGEVAWSVADLRAGQDVFDVAEQWSAGVAGELGDYSGALFRAVADGTEPSRASGEVTARIAYFRYIEQGSPQALAAARQAIEEALAEGHRSSVLLAMAASALAVGIADRYCEDPHDLVLAEGYAREALALDPRSGHAHCALGTVAMARKQPEMAVLHGREAARFNPYHPSLLATAGLLVAHGGQWDEGIAIFRRALELHPAHPGTWHGILAVDRLIAADDAGALAEAAMIPDAGLMWGCLYRSLALAGLGHMEQAQSEFDSVLRFVPDFLDDPYTHIAGHRMHSRERMAPLLHRVALIADARESKSVDAAPEALPE
jgi:TolB-like protein/tetratricopeptide (TPR) repeat protein